MVDETSRKALLDLDEPVRAVLRMALIVRLLTEDLHIGEAHDGRPLLDPDKAAAIDYAGEQMARAARELYEQHFEAFMLARCEGGTV